MLELPESLLDYLAFCGASRREHKIGLYLFEALIGLVKNSSCFANSIDPSKLEYLGVMLDFVCSSNTFILQISKLMPKYFYICSPLSTTLLIIYGRLVLSLSWKFTLSS